MVVVVAVVLVVLGVLVSVMVVVSYVVASWARDLFSGEQLGNVQSDTRGLDPKMEHEMDRKLEPK